MLTLFVVDFPDMLGLIGQGCATKAPSGGGSAAKGVVTITVQAVGQGT